MSRLSNKLFRTVDIYNVAAGVCCGTRTDGGCECDVRSANQGMLEAVGRTDWMDKLAPGQRIEADADAKIYPSAMAVSHTHSSLAMCAVVPKVSRPIE